MPNPRLRDRNKRKEDIELPDLPKYPDSPENPYVQKLRQPDRTLQPGGAEGWLPAEIAMESEGPLSNFLSVHNYLAEQYGEQTKLDQLLMDLIYKGKMKGPMPPPSDKKWKTR